MTKTTVAAIQWTPAYHDIDAGLAKAKQAITAAANQGARLVVFPETWLQGYPYWASIGVRDPRFHTFRRKLDQCAIERDGPELLALCEAASQSKAAVVIGFHERDGASIYNAAAYISAAGKLQRIHRKLMPTTTERLVWGQGDGSDLDPVTTPAGITGGLICFEHQMAPARLTLCNLGVQIHAALWPGHAFIDGVIDASTRQLAHENGCFVIVARETMTHSALDPGLPDVSDDPERWQTHGGSAIIGPDGAYIVEPVYDREDIVLAEIDLKEIADAKWWFDGAGHYTRPDVFSLHWNPSPKPSFHRSADEKIETARRDGGVKR